MKRGYRVLIFFLITTVFLFQSVFILCQDSEIRRLIEGIENSEGLVKQYQETLYTLIEPMKFPEYVLYSKEEYAKILKERRKENETD